MVRDEVAAGAPGPRVDLRRPGFAATAGVNFGVLRGLVCGALCGLSAAAHAQAWSMAVEARAGIEHDDNPALSEPRAASVSSWRWGATLRLQGETEREKTRGELELQQVRPIGYVARADGRLAVQHELTTPHDRLSLALEGRRDRPLDSPRSATEAALGAERRNQRSASAQWTHRPAERVDVQAQLSRTVTTYETTLGGSATRRQAQGSAALGAGWAASESTRLGATFSRSDQELKTQGQRYRIDQGRVDLDHAATEVLSGRLSLGLSRSMIEQDIVRLACPLPIQFCDSGLVRPILVTSTLEARSRETSASALLDWRVDERTSLSMSGSRALAPGVAGTARETLLNARFARRLGERTEAGASLAQSRSRPADGPSGSFDATLLTAAAWMDHTLEPAWSVSVRFEHRQLSSASANGTGRSHRVSINLQYSGATISLRR